MEEIYEDRLKRLRVAISMEEKIAPYSVFDDEELASLVKARPCSLQELAKIKGFPAKGARVTKWGTRIVGAFSASNGNTNLNSFGG